MIDPFSEPNNDFNGDGHSDILWRSDQTGEVYTWITNPNGGFADYYVPSHAQVSMDWHVVGIGDFNGDNKEDILWRHDSGLIHTWLADGNGGFSDNSLNSAVGISTEWHVEGVGDFNGDGKDDILWRDNDGTLATWLGATNGGFSDNYLNSVVNVPTQWHVAGIGDFNDDGKDDILWRNNDGLVTDWLGEANGGFAQNYYNSVADVPHEWQIIATGDFNGDGRSDILWRHDTGVVCDWLGQANGGFVNNYSNSVVALTLDWHAAEIGDFNGDGRDDVLWRQDNGDGINWSGQNSGGFSPNSSYSIAGTQSSVWHLEGLSLV